MRCAQHQALLPEVKEGSGNLAMMGSEMGLLGLRGQTRQFES